MKKNLLADAFNFWDKLYEKYYWNPTSVSVIVIIYYNKVLKECSNCNSTVESEDV